jgi:hypothetical protein
MSYTREEREAIAINIRRFALTHDEEFFATHPDKKLPPLQYSKPMTEYGRVWLNIIADEVEGKILFNQ